MEGLFCEHLDVFSETFPTSGMTANGVAYELPTWEPRTDDSASSSSQPDEALLLTPVAAEGTKPSNTMGVARRQSTGQVFLTNQIVTLCGLDPSEDTTARQGTPEGASPALLPTPAAGNFNDSEEINEWEARRARVKESSGNGNGFGMPLAIAARMITASTGDHMPRLFVDGKPCEEPHLPLPN